MCLILFAYQMLQDTPLLLAANRDEFFARPASPLQQWPDEPDIFAGRDTKAGGTWLGVSAKGRFAAVTNFRNGQIVASQQSRGELVSAFLRSDLTPEAFVRQELQDPGQFAGFNLLLASREGLYYFSNRSPRPSTMPQSGIMPQPETMSQPGIRKLTPGIYGLSNHLLDTPWPKVSRGKSMLQHAIDSGQRPDEEALWGLLSDTTRPDDAALPDTGIGLKNERTLSSAFIRDGGYGTRCSTLLFLNNGKGLLMKEKTFPPPDLHNPAMAPELRTINLPAFSL
jgi:uncharacterized protein with NRDE domain